MNDYRITYTYNAENGTRENIHITERSEAAARKDFKAHHKDGTILDVELIAENVPATKDQEREALATIRKIVEELGPQSYIGTAFEGCFQDAEDNIEYEYGCSMKQKLESAELDVAELAGKLAAAEKRIEEFTRLMDRLKEERSALERKLAGQTLPEWLRFDLHAFATEQEITARKSMASAAEIMAEMADTPQDIAFTNAVNSYRKAKEQHERCAKILSGLDTLAPEE